MFQNLFQARSAGLSNYVCYRKYRHPHPHWQIQCQNMVVTTRWYQPVISCAFLKSEWRQLFDGARPFVTLLSCSMTFFWSFPSNCRFPNFRQQSSRMIILREKLWQRDRINIIGLKEGYHQKNTDFESYLLVKMQYFFNSVPYIFLEMHQSSNWEMFISNNNKYSWFLFLVCKI